MVKVLFKYYLQRNQFKKNVNTALKYLRRYDVEKFDDKIQKFEKVTRKKSVSRKPPLYEYQKNKIAIS